eukprot:TRINITY_DN30276_c0_g1_i1.p1 TRINITY_DN30276_c0_g1~~TRINITY_DN30276_c0_g1_i1.p1  ORF type:complete len:568 (+),score=133.52 TRINITY_DN30276_c0_g1_i1:47-1750(+)
MAWRLRETPSRLAKQEAMLAGQEYQEAAHASQGRRSKQPAPDEHRKIGSLHRIAAMISQPNQDLETARVRYVMSSTRRWLPDHEHRGHVSLRETAGKVRQATRKAMLFQRITDLLSPEKTNWEAEDVQMKMEALLNSPPGSPSSGPAEAQVLVAGKSDRQLLFEFLKVLKSVTVENTSVEEAEALKQKLFETWDALDPSTSYYTTAVMELDKLWQRLELVYAQKKMQQLMRERHKDVKSWADQGLRSMFAAKKAGGKWMEGLETHSVAGGSAECVDEGRDVDTVEQARLGASSAGADQDVNVQPRASTQEMNDVDEDVNEEMIIRAFNQEIHDSISTSIAKLKMLAEDANSHARVAKQAAGRGTRKSTVEDLENDEELTPAERMIEKLLEDAASWVKVAVIDGREADEAKGVNGDLDLELKEVFGWVSDEDAVDENQGSASLQRRLPAYASQQGRKAWSAAHRDSSAGRRGKFAKYGGETNMPRRFRKPNKPNPTVESVLIWRTMHRFRPKVIHPSLEEAWTKISEAGPKATCPAQCCCGHCAKSFVESKAAAYKASSGKAFRRVVW